MTQQADLTSTSTVAEPVFSNPQEEIAHLRQKLLSTQQEFLEFQESSRELEVEYETQIKQLDKNSSQANVRLVRLEDENEQLRERYSAYTSDTQHKLNEYQNQIGELTAVNDRLTSYIRELEQSNDDLERARRALAASLEDFEAQLNQQIERNVLLENEVSEKEELECVVQRLKEEARDLRHELIAKNNKSDLSKRDPVMDKSMISSTPTLSQPTTISSMSSCGAQSGLNEITATKQNDSSLINGTSSTPKIISIYPRDGSSGKADSLIADDSYERRVPMIDSTTSPIVEREFSFESSNACGSSETTTKSVDSKSQQTSTPSSPTKPPAIAMSPASRISALNIVSDLLRKVGALESKLASAKKVTSNHHQ